MKALWLGLLLLVGCDPTWSSDGNVGLPRCYGRIGWQHEGTRLSSLKQQVGDSAIIIEVCR